MLYAIVNRNTGEYWMAENGKCTWHKPGAAKLSWALSQVPVTRWSKGHKPWEVIEVKLSPVGGKRMTAKEWLDEPTSYGRRFDWAAAEVGPKVPNNLEKWLQIAYFEGFKQGEM